MGARSSAFGRKQRSHVAQIAGTSHEVEQLQPSWKQGRLRVMSDAGLIAKKREEVLAPFPILVHKHRFESVQQLDRLCEIFNGADKEP